MAGGRGWTMEMRRETLWRNFKSGGVLCVTCVGGALATWRIVNSGEGGWCVIQVIQAENECRDRKCVHSRLHETEKWGMRGREGKGSERFSS